MNSEEGLITLFATLGLFIIIVAIIVLLVAIPVIIAQWKFFKKAGKNGWEAIVPYYNTWVLIEISGLHWWYFLISIGLSILSIMSENLSLLTSAASCYINFVIYYNIAKRTKQNEILYGILGIFVPFVPVLILGFSKSIIYDKTIEVKPNGVF